MVVGGVLSLQMVLLFDGNLVVLLTKREMNKLGCTVYELNASII